MVTKGRDLNLIATQHLNHRFTRLYRVAVAVDGYFHSALSSSHRPVGVNLRGLLADRPDIHAGREVLQ